MAKLNAFHPYVQIFSGFFFLCICFFPDRAFPQRGAVYNVRISGVEDSAIWVRDIIPDGRGGYIVAGQTGNDPIITYFLMRLDCRGQILWSKKKLPYVQPNTGFSASGRHPIILHLGKDDVISVFDPVDRCHIARALFDVEGRLVTAKIILDAEGNVFDFLGYLRYVDGGWIVMGERVSYTVRGLQYNLALFRLDASFNVLWKRNLEFVGNRFRNSLREVVEILHNRIIILDSKASNWFDYIEIDQQGKIIAAREYIINPVHIHSYGRPYDILWDSLYYYFFVNYYENRDTVLRHNLALVKVDRKTGKLLTTQVVTDPTGVRRPVSGWINNSAVHAYWNEDSMLCASVFVSNYDRDLTSAPYYNHGYPVHLCFDTALNPIYARRYGIERAIVVRDTFGAHNRIRINDSSFTFAAHYNLSEFARDLKGSFDDYLFLGKRSIRETSCIDELDMMNVFNFLRLDPNTIQMREIRSILEGTEVFLLEDTTLQIVKFEVEREVICFEPPYLKANISINDTVFCIGDTIQLTATNSLEANRYFWYIGDSLVNEGLQWNYVPKREGRYKWTLVVEDDCFTDSSSVEIVVYGNDTSYLERQICEGDTLFIHGKSYYQEGHYLISNVNKHGCDSIVMLDLVVKSIDTVFNDTILCRGQIYSFQGVDIKSDTTVWFNELDEKGCIKVVRFDIEYDESCDLCTVQIPLAFTPNGDGLNDIFRIINPCSMKIDSFHMRIYSRWGEMVFETTVPEQGWDGTYHGKELPADIYLVYISGSVKGQGAIIIKKDVILVR